MSLLGPGWTGRRVLDCFAGSGALGFEALSRGAHEIVFVDASLGACQALHRTAAALDVADNVTVINDEASRALVRMAAAGELFDVLFLDPPYAAGLLQDALETASPLCAPRGVIVAEHESRDADSLSAHIGHSLHRADQREYGRTSVTIYRRRNPEEET